MYHCSHCDAQSLKWQGRCPECGKWGTYVDASGGESGAKNKGGTATKPSPVISLKDARGVTAKPMPTGISELDRVLSGGLVAGSVTLLSGEPGIGKSTLVAKIATELASATTPAYYVSGEESDTQVAMRFTRLGLPLTHIQFTNDTDINAILGSAEKMKPSLLIIDSIQTMVGDDDAIAGSPNAVRRATSLCVEFAKTLGVPVLLIGQVTKDGNIAGPKTLEHIVDTVLTLEGDTRGHYRILRANKHRFGTTDEIGIFEMTGTGLSPVDNPSAKFLEERQNHAGSVITCVMEGTRPLLVEIQALVEKSFYPNPVRRTSGIDSGRLQVLVAIAGKRAGVRLGDQDIYVNVVGGMKIKEHAIDLAVVSAIVSALKDKIMPEKTVVFGELGLGGEIRHIPFEDRRVLEAKRLGYTNIISPKNAKHVSDLFKG